MKINLKKIIAVAALTGTAMSVFAAPKFNSKKVDYTTDEAAITNSTAVMLTSVAGDQYAIGYVSLGSLNDSVKAVKIDGADATVANINNGSYKISRPFNIAVKGGLSPVSQDFVNYISFASYGKINRSIQKRKSKCKN